MRAVALPEDPAVEERGDSEAEAASLAAVRSAQRTAKPVLANAGQKHRAREVVIHDWRKAKTVVIIEPKFLHHRPGQRDEVHERIGPRNDRQRDDKSGIVIAGILILRLNRKNNK